MKRVVFISLAFYSGFTFRQQAVAQFNLPFEVTCNSTTWAGQGGIICAQDKSQASVLKVKIPPTKGQLRVVDCDNDLTDNKRPNDFNTVTFKEGFWLWSRSVRRLDTTPLFSLPAKSRKDCAIAVSVYGDQAGLQMATIIQEPAPLDHIADLPCLEASTGLYTCSGLEGARLTVASKTPGTLLILGSGCGINIRSETGVTVLKLPKGACVVDLALVTADSSKRARLLLLGRDRQKRELDTPLMVLDGANRRIIKPLGASMTATEIYLGDQVLWRSGVRADDSYKLDPSKDNADGLGNWPQGSVGCHSAYSAEFNSFSGSCFDMNSGTELPYTFK